MSLKSTAQQNEHLITLVLEPSQEGNSHDNSGELEVEEAQLVPFGAVFDDPNEAAKQEPTDFISEEPSEHEPHEHEHSDEPLEVVDSDNDLKGLLENESIGLGGPDPEIEVSEVQDVEDENKVDENDAKKPKKNEKWDWESKGASGFIVWVKERCNDVPKHSGYDSAGLDRAIAYLERLDNEISKAMRLDLDGELDADQIEKVRATIDNGIERLQDRLDKVKTHKKSKRKKKADEVTEGMVKEAQKITGVSGIMVTVDLLTSRIARVCINGMVSAGHDIEDLYARQVKEYGLNKREQASVMQLLSDMGYALKQDRGYMPDGDFDPASTDNMDLAQNFKG